MVSEIGLLGQSCSSQMTNQTKTTTALLGVSCVFLTLFAAFALKLWGRPPQLPEIPLVDPSFTSNATARISYAQLIKAGADVSDFDCYGCHEKNKPPPLRFDAQHNLIIPKEHADIVMHHGTHNRNNLCFNCHDESNLEVFQTRDGRQLKLVDSTPLCGSCHGPTYRDWDAGAHGRTSGYWNRSVAPDPQHAITRQDCVSCHNPHSPKFPSRQPAPGPHPLRPPHEARVQGSGLGIEGSGFRVQENAERLGVRSGWIGSALDVADISKEKRQRTGALQDAGAPTHALALLA
ncbi:MAG: hypothetical protein C5B50_22835 [Verrucomicrobia bacterium]|nr:MAG: hypothetical protein C5B50_22835 [Verrucomicrobiota bacterium]